MTTNIDVFMVAYHARDDTTAWEIYRRSHTPAGNSLTKDLIDGFLAHKTDVESHEKLQVLNYLGQLETRRAEDAYTADLAKVYALATPQTQALLVQARQQVADDRELFNQSKIDNATELFVSARKLFEEVGDLPESLAADAAITRGARGPAGSAERAGSAGTHCSCLQIEALQMAACTTSHRPGSNPIQSR